MILRDGGDNEGEEDDNGRSSFSRKINNRVKEQKVDIENQQAISMSVLNLVKSNRKTYQRTYVSKSKLSKNLCGSTELANKSREASMSILNLNESPFRSSCQGSIGSCGERRCSSGFSRPRRSSRRSEQPQGWGLAALYARFTQTFHKAWREVRFKGKEGLQL